MGESHGEATGLAFCRVGPADSAVIGLVSDPVPGQTNRYRVTGTNNCETVIPKR